MELKIDQDFQNALVPLTDEDYKNLRNDILQHGCRDSLITWQGSIIDGHHRYKICRESGKSFQTIEYDFSDKDDALAYIIKNQLSRRNLTTWQRCELALKLEEMQKQIIDTDIAFLQKVMDATGCSSCKHSILVLLTEERICSLERLNRPWYEEAPKACSDWSFDGDQGWYEWIEEEDQNHSDLPGDHCEPKVRPSMQTAQLAGVGFNTMSKARQIRAKATSEQIMRLQNRDASVKGIYREIKHKERQVKEAEARQALSISEMPDTKYQTIIIDPPWPVQKILRDVRPNQSEFDYPTMTLEEIEKFPIGDLSADDCHLFVWTTQKFLPQTFYIMDSWGFKYVLTMVWHKSGGFQPFGLPQYNCEFVVYGRKGKSAFSDTKDFACCFNGKRREHSRKPEEFYSLIRRVSPELRIDIFSREIHEGFDQYGNEPDKFSE